MEKFGFSMLWFWSAYFIVTIIGVLHTVFHITVLHMKSMKESDGMGEAYDRTKPWHPLYNLLIFPAFACLYLKSLDTITLSNAMATSILWGTITVVFDLFGWVLVKHPWSLSPKEFYVDYQPWLTLIYLVIYVSPFLAYGILMIK